MLKLTKGLKLKKLLILAIIILFLCLSVSYVEAEQGFCWSEELKLHHCYDTKTYDKGATIYDIYEQPYNTSESSYRIIPIIDKESIDPGQNITISFQVSGGGKVESNLLVIYFPEDFLSPKDKPTFYDYLAESELINLTNNSNKKRVAIWFDETPRTTTIRGIGVTGKLISTIFSEVNPNKRIIFGEKKIKGHSPLVFESPTNKKATRGDNTIKIVFRYTDGIKWYNTQEEIKIHVNSFTEQYDLEILLFIALLGAFSLPLTKYLWNKYEENIKKLKPEFDTFKQLGYFYMWLFFLIILILALTQKLKLNKHLFVVGLILLIFFNYKFVKTLFEDYS